MVPKYINFNYRNKERVWLKVHKIESNYYCVSTILFLCLLIYCLYFIVFDIGMLSI